MQNDCIFIQCAGNDTGSLASHRDAFPVSLKRKSFAVHHIIACHTAEHADDLIDIQGGLYLRQHRIRHAVSLLEQTDQSIARIGAACGFDDMSYFARIFRAERGCTPSEYREKLRK